MPKPHTVAAANVTNPVELELARLKAELARTQAALAEANKPRPMSMKVSEKGALSVYGLGRFPVTLYRGQWERLLAPDNVASINSFIAAHPELKTKGE